METPSPSKDNLAELQESILATQKLKETELAGLSKQSEIIQSITTRLFQKFEKWEEEFDIETERQVAIAVSATRKRRLVVKEKQRLEFLRTVDKRRFDEVAKEVIEDEIRLVNKNFENDLKAKRAKIDAILTNSDQTSPATLSEK